MKLRPFVNELVKFKLHESADIYEATVLAYDGTGYWVKGGSLISHLRGEALREDAEIAFVEIARIHWMQRV